MIEKLVHCVLPDNSLRQDLSCKFICLPFAGAMLGGKWLKNNKKYKEICTYIQNELKFLGHIMRKDCLENITPTEHWREGKQEKKVNNHLNIFYLHYYVFDRKKVSCFT